MFEFLPFILGLSIIVAVLIIILLRNCFGKIGSKAEKIAKPFKDGFTDDKEIKP
jgi:Sec-independent protein translocase protein TatA